MGRSVLKLIMFGALVGTWVWVLPVAAENGPIAAAYNMLRSGSFCGLVRASEVRGAGIECSERSPGSLSALAPLRSVPEILRTTVYRDAAQLEIPRNECLRQQVEAMRRDPARRREWISYLVSAWLGIRKSQLMRQACSSLFDVHLDPARVRRLGLERAFAEWERRSSSRPSTPANVQDARAPLRDVCLNEGARAALRNAEALYAATVPVLSSSEAFAAIEDSRSSLINRETGRPISDSEIGRLDLRALSSLSVRLDAGALKRIDDAVSVSVNQRNSMRASLESVANGEAPSAAVRDFLYDDGAVWQSLVNRNLIRTDMMGRPVEITSAAGCVLAAHEPSFVGSLLEFGVESAALGGALGAVGLVGRVTSAGAQLTRFQRAQRLVGLGAVGVLVRDTTASAYRSCISTEGRANRLQDQERSQRIVALSGAEFPEPFHYVSRAMAFGPDDAPACQNGVARDQTESSQQANCVRDTLDNVLPPWAQVLSVAIPR